MKQVEVVIGQGYDKNHKKVINMVYEDIVQEMEDSKLNELISAGLSHDDIAKSIQECFKEFFENDANLKRYSNDFLVSDYINYYKNYYEGINDNIKGVVSLLRAAKEIDENTTYEYMAILQNELVEVSNKEWSFTILQKDFKELGTYEFVIEAFNLIENICENALKVYLRFLLVFFRITKSKNNISMQIINEIKFGNIVNELSQCVFLKDLFNINGYEIPLSQWRNIACHKDYKIISDKIECQYGDKHSKNVIINSKEDLLGITKNIYKILQFINFAAKFFLYDNIEKVQPFYSLIKENTDSRPENWHLPFVTELYTNGFKVISIDQDNVTVKVKVKSIVSDDIKKIAVQSTIVLYKVWSYALCTKLQVSYLDEKSNVLLSVETSDDVCKLIAQGEKDIYYLADKMKILYCDNSIK